MRPTRKRPILGRLPTRQQFAPGWLPFLQPRPAVSSPSASRSSSSARSGTVSPELDERRRRVREFIDTNFGSQRAFCEATGLKPARVSKALQDRYISNRRLLPLEHAMEKWRADRGAGTESDDPTVPVYRLTDQALRPVGDREPIGDRALGGPGDRDDLLYVEVTHGHHAVVERGRADRRSVDDLRDEGRSETIVYAGLVGGVWTYVPIRFGDDGRAHPPPDVSADDLVLFGRTRAVLRLHLPAR